MKVLVVGGGGREHSLVWKLKQSPRIKQIYIAPGNVGTSLLGENIEARTTSEILEWLQVHKMDLVIIGPDNYLAEGLTDLIQQLGIAVFGPTKAAAEIEWSKSYAKRFMQEENIPTARYQVFETTEQALGYVRGQKFPLVVKADGLAAGKGVVIATTLEEAERAIDDIMNARIHGDSGARVVIEDYLDGFEISVHVFCDGDNAILFPSSKDHKRIFDGDNGPNTGGMGTIAPVPLVSEKQMRIIRERIVVPTLAGLKKRGRPFKGILFPGIMLTNKGPMVIEFNARFGDPETQSYMRILESDLFDILSACASGSLKDFEIKWSDHYACCIVLASEGYPNAYEKGIPITLPAVSRDVVIFHAGTTLHEGQLVTDGGRVLGITAIGETLEQALETAYDSISSDIFNGVQYRKDIGTVAH
ncbi:MAG: phosphoribosylamine--glycine ligase [Candidatus Uhrbacteria bacterium]|nr:phosphoribosylamine--glycine ligase [Candidatus Uhrbacteria bacterium]